MTSKELATVERAAYQRGRYMAALACEVALDDRSEAHAEGSRYDRIACSFGIQEADAYMSDRLDEVFGKEYGWELRRDIDEFVYGSLEPVELRPAVSAVVLFTDEQRESFRYLEEIIDSAVLDEDYDPSGSGFFASNE